ncbi:hydrolase 1, exosortase A system-associated [Sphingomonas sp. XXL09]|uniref:hydrolase 1, exosortase A system-associated n=1 Tax=Sphingomonas sp. XXL09 TaxID=3457787 RepID=UPI00406BBF54
MRSVITFACAGETLFATLDAAPGTTGLLIVSGGNEIRVGAHRGMAQLAAAVAAAGHPVFRYDRRGVGDSGGVNGGFLSSEADLTAAVAAFRSAQPQIETLVGFGNCDGATTLALYGRAAGIDRVLLANPWVVEDADDGLPPQAAIRARYAARLRDPAAWWRLVSGGIDVRKAVSGLRKITTPAAETSLARRVTAAIGDWGGSAHILLAEGDATAIAFRAAAPEVAAEMVATASHSFARDGDQAALLAAVLRVLR